MSEKLYRVVTSRRLANGQDDERVLGQGSTLWHARGKVAELPSLAQYLTAAGASARAIEEQEHDDRTRPQFGWRTWVEEAT